MRLFYVCIMRDFKVVFVILVILVMVCTCRDGVPTTGGSCILDVAVSCF